MTFSHRLLLGTTLTLFAAAAQAQVYFQDSGSYTFNGFSNSYTIGGRTQSNPTMGVDLPVLIPTNTTVTVSFLVSGLANGGTTTFISLRESSTSFNSTGLNGAGPALSDGQYSLSVVSTGPSQYALFGPNSWGISSAVTISNICIFGPGGCVSGPSASDTTTALQALAASLRTPLVLSKAAAENALSYDCDRFDAKNLCFTAIGRRLSGSADYSENAGAIMLVYKLTPQWRVGGYIDQGASASTANLRVASDMPLVGINATWNARPDGEGLEVRGGAAFRQQSLDVSRSTVGTSEAGSGSTQQSSTLASISAAYHRRLSETLTVAPYAGLRYYHGQLDGYTEGGSNSVTAPLTYVGLAEQAVTASVGVRLHGRSGKTRGMASIGLDRDLSGEIDSLSASGVSGVNPLPIAGYERHATRAVASLGLSHDLNTRQSIALTALYRQEAFRDTATTAVFAQYRVGF